MKMRRGILIFISILLACLVSMLIPLKSESKNAGGDVTINDFKKWAASLSRQEIVSEIDGLTRKVAELEKTTGQVEPEGYRLYSSRETAQFIELYQAIQLRLHYLSTGNLDVNLGQWEGYQFSSAKTGSFTNNEIEKAVAELQKKAKLPGVFFNRYAIYQLPFVIPDVSGLGGADFTLLSARPAAEDVSDSQLRVTLYHEIGHHVHLKYMPASTGDGKNLWEEYLRIRGGTWHGPGQVNTSNWSNSSEETFAEDFRMLFGPEQPYYGDIALGDPRVHSNQAQDLRKFMLGLASGKTGLKTDSPWIPQGEISFWEWQGRIIFFLWCLTGIGFGTVYFLGSFKFNSLGSHSFRGSI
jgi:hypothetical protein